MTKRPKILFAAPKTSIRTRVIRLMKGAIYTTNVLIGITIVSLCTAAIIYSIYDKGITSDAAAWAQAAGSVAAVYGAVWVSSQEARRQRRQQQQQRDNTAFNLKYAVLLARDEATNIYLSLSSTEQTADSFRSWRLQCSNARSLIINFLGKSDQIHPGIVQDAVNASLLVEEMSAVIEVISQQTTSRISDELLSKISSYQLSLHELVHRIDQRMFMFERHGDFEHEWGNIPPPEDAFKIRLPNKKS